MFMAVHRNAAEGKIRASGTPLGPRTGALLAKPRERLNRHSGSRVRSAWLQPNPVDANYVNLGEEVICHSKQNS
jgi:hypothetical protein